MLYLLGNQIDQVNTGLEQVLQIFLIALPHQAVEQHHAADHHNERADVDDLGGFDEVVEVLVDGLDQVLVPRFDNEPGYIVYGLLHIIGVTYLSRGTRRS